MKDTLTSIERPAQPPSFLSPSLGDPAADAPIDGDESLMVEGGVAWLTLSFALP